MHIVTKSTTNESKSMEQLTSGANTATPVGRMFSGRSVFITGASGFVGRVLLEKLLRCYDEIKNIYILMRAKKNQNPLDRLHKQLLKAPIFDAIRAKPNGSSLLDKIIVIPGDIGEPNLGISDEDMTTMLNDETLSIVFHSAATIKFNEPLKVAVRLNLTATKTMIEFCRRLPNLISVCHVSTAFTNSDQTDGKPIEEKLYPMKYKPDDLIAMAEIMDQNLMETLKESLLSQHANTYTYTKALAEHMIAKEAADLPIAIVRPSIIVAAWKQPIPGWVDNLTGVTGIVFAVENGLLRTMNGNNSGVADFIPVDVVVNTMIASAFHAAVINNKLKLDGSSEVAPKSNVRHIGMLNTIDEGECDLMTSTLTIQSQKIDNGPTNGKTKLDRAHDADNLTNQGEKNVRLPDHHDNKQTRAKRLPIIHCNSGDLNPITWGVYMNMFLPVIGMSPSCRIPRYFFGLFRGNRYHDLVARVFVHYLPAIILDFLCVLMGKKRQLLAVYNRLHYVLAILTYFFRNNFHFKTNNMKLVQASLSDEDRQQLYMDIENLEWRSACNDYLHGISKFVLKEEDHKLSGARKSFARVYGIEICLRVLLTIAGLVLFTYLGYGVMSRALWFKSFTRTALKGREITHFLMVN